jgi:FKBP-type peptidyl-prolyl cis-trans isomerase SlyD
MRGFWPINAGLERIGCMMSVNKIADGVVVSMAYVLTVDGEEVGHAGADEPMEYLHGAENIVPGLEAALEGRGAGDHVQVTIPPEDAYGEYDDEDIDQFSTDEIAGIEELEEGMFVEVENDEGEIYVGTVVEISPDGVVVDFNPPLAGKTLTFDVKILGLREANPDELDHGHPHSLHDYYEDEEE